MNEKLTFYLLFFISITGYGCSTIKTPSLTQDINENKQVRQDKIWLSHEHILVDFIGADLIQSNESDHDEIIKEILPYINTLKKYQVNYFVDATPEYLGRDVILLDKISKITGIKIITNTGFYGARNNKFIPKKVQGMAAQDIANLWIDEYENGIKGTTIKPGFIKIGIDSADVLHPMHEKLVKAAAITHLKTGLTIASHTGEAKGLWPQLKILEAMGVPPESFIWVHAQFENNNDAYLKAAKIGCWVSLDGLGWELDKHIEKIEFAKKHGILDRLLISHDAGWYDPQKEVQSIKPYTAIFTKLLPELKSRGFTDDELNLLMSKNPERAFALNPPH